MVRDEHMPWCWLLLGILKESGGVATLAHTYRRIETDITGQKEGESPIIDPRLFRHNLKYGDRPIYQHTVRGCLSLYEKQGLVERIGRGTYRITEAGLRRLDSY